MSNPCANKKPDLIGGQAINGKTAVQQVTGAISASNRPRLCQIPKQVAHSMRLPLKK